MRSIYAPEDGSAFYLNPQLSIGAPRVDYGNDSWPSQCRFLVPPEAPPRFPTIANLIYFRALG